MNKLFNPFTDLLNPTLHVRLAIQTTIAVVLATILAFLCQVSAPYWAAITAAIVVSANVGAAIDKSLMRMAGTLIGGVIGILLVICLANHLYWFIASLTLLILFCSYYAAIFTRYQYAFVLLPVTTVLVALPAVHAPASIYLLAATRVIEVLLGIVAVWIVSFLVFPIFAKHKLSKELADLVLILKNSFSELADVYLIEKTSGRQLTIQQQKINQQLNNYKKLIEFAKKEWAGDKFDDMQVLNNIRNTRLLLAQQIHFSNTLQQAAIIKVPVYVAPLLNEAVAVLIQLFDQAIKPAAKNKRDISVIQLQTLLQTIYQVWEEHRKTRAIYQYTLQETTAFYTFLELIEKTQYYIINMLDYKPAGLNQEKHKDSLAQRFVNNITEIKHAVKVALSALLVMLIWLCTNWLSAVLAIVSVLAVAQLNMYSSKTKAKLRIAGCLLGGIVGIVLISLPISLTLFYLLAAAAVAIFAYIAAGNRADIGVQANVALLTTVVTLWGAPLVITPAIDRLAGVLLGSSIAAVVGYFIWPLNPLNNLHKWLAINYQEFAQWLNLLDQQNQSLRISLINRLAKAETYLPFLADKALENKYQHLIDLQYELFFILFALNHHKTSKDIISTALRINMNDYLQQSASQLNYFAERWLAKPVTSDQVNIDQVLQQAREQLLAIRQTKSIIVYEVYQAKEFIVAMNEIIQLLVCLQRTEKQWMDLSQ